MHFSINYLYRIERARKNRDLIARIEIISNIVSEWFYSLSIQSNTYYTYTILYSHYRNDNKNSSLLLYKFII